MKKILSVKEYDKCLLDLIENGNKQAVIDFMKNSTYIVIDPILISSTKESDLPTLPNECHSSQRV